MVKTDKRVNRILTLTLIVLAACTESDSPNPNGNQTAKYAGTVSMNANLSSSEPLSRYILEHQEIRNSGAGGAQTAAPWASLNPTGTTYDLTPLTNSFFGLSKLVTYGYDTIYLNIPIITINTRSMPADIAGLSFDHATVKARFRSLLDAIKDQLVPEVKYVSFGNEVDTYFSTHPSEWTAYKNLVEDARSYLKTLKPSIKVGVTTTFNGATSFYLTQVTDLNANMDAIMLTYYPVSPTFVPALPSSVGGDVLQMVQISQGKPVVMQEWGYPSSTALGSSESAQAEFVFKSFEALEKQGPAKFPFVNFFKYRDWDSAYVQTLTGQQPGQPFYEFMSSLGLKRNDGTPKEGLQVVQDWEIQ